MPSNSGAGLRWTVLALASLVVLSACKGERVSGRGEAAGGQGRIVEQAGLPGRFDLGTEPSAARLASVNIDANPAGVGLPKGAGTYAKGAQLYAQQCAACHGVKGEGLGPFPRLIGVEHQQNFAFNDDPKYTKTIGNYWPYATTLYDYVHRAMPFTAPGSLKPDEVYSLVAYLLAENGIVAASAGIDEKTLPGIKMPARDRFVPDDRAGGPTFK